MEGTDNRRSAPGKDRRGIEDPQPVGETTSPLDEISPPSAGEASSDKSRTSQTPATFSRWTEVGGRVQRKLMLAMQSDAKPREAVKLGNRYELTRSLGRGGFGSVWHAERFKKPKKEVAVKVFDAALEPGLIKEAAARFWQQAQFLATADDPRLVNVIDGPEVSKGLLWFAMEYCKGGTLATMIANCEPRPTQLPAIVSQLLEGLDAIHRMGHTHRDLKPSNILVREKHPAPLDLVLSDLDLSAAFLHSDQTTATNTKTFVDTQSRYCPPEIAGLGDGKRAASRAPAFDVYGVCMVLFDYGAGPHAARPTSVSRRALRRAFSARWPECTGDESAKLDALARLLTIGLSEPAKRYKAVAPMRDAWNAFQRAPLDWLLWPIALLLAALVFLVGDWLAHVGGAVGNMALALVGTVAATAAAPLIKIAQAVFTHTHPQGALATSSRRIAARLGSTGLIVTALAAPVSCVAVLFLSRLPYRMTHTQITSTRDAQCHAVTSYGRGPQLPHLREGERLATPLDWVAINCSHGRITLRELTFLRVLPPVDNAPAPQPVPEPTPDAGPEPGPVPAPVPTPRPPPLLVPRPRLPREGERCAASVGCKAPFKCEEQFDESLGKKVDRVVFDTGQRGAFSAANIRTTVGTRCAPNHRRVGNPWGDGSSNTTCGGQWASSSPKDCSVTVTAAHGLGRWHCRVLFKMAKIVRNSAGHRCVK